LEKKLLLFKDFFTPLLLTFFLLSGALAADTLPDQPSFRSGPSILSDLSAITEINIGFFINWNPDDKFSVKDLRFLREDLDSHGGILLVGRTDAMGPASLNKSLGLQLAVNAAQELTKELSIEPWRISCASFGEVAGEEPGILAYPWQPKLLSKTEPSRVLIKLAPPKSKAKGGNVWALWAPDSDDVIVGFERESKSSLWRLMPFENPAFLPFPALSTEIALAAGQGSEETAYAGLKPPRFSMDDSLKLNLIREEAWTAYLSAEIPEGYRDVVVWSSGIPYFLDKPSQGGRAEFKTALMTGANSAYIQAVTPQRRIVVGSELTLPDGPTKRPELLAILTWDNKAVDLDLHAWAGKRHTHPGNDDAYISSKAVNNTRLIFDGNGFEKASALVVWDLDGLSIEVRCFGAMGEEATNAWVHLLSNPGDPEKETHTVLGPRLISERPMEFRWPFYPLD